MRSRAEWALRAAALAALALLLWTALRPPSASARVGAARGGLERALVDATREAVPVIDIDLDSAPDPVHREWLGAIRAAGTDVAWRADDLIPIAVGVSRVPEPEGRLRVTVAGADSARVVLSDALGQVDTLAVGASQSSRLLRTATGSVAAAGGGNRAVTPLPPPSSVRRLLVLGAAGWEAKFVVAALEEAGWSVDARIRVAPGVETRQGGNFALDTARYSAVIALDASATPLAGAIERFVSTGGGAVLAGAVTRQPAFARIAPGSAGPGRIAGGRPGLRLGGIKRDAVILESQRGVALVAARRAGFGRVVASGYDETWRWRMRPGADAAASHRDWWTAAISAVAYVPLTAQRDSVAGKDPAPVAALIAALGPPADGAGTAAVSTGWIPPTWLLFGVLIGSLLAEVLSRRTRGLA